jgi:hypothetical protein
MPVSKVLPESERRGVIRCGVTSYPSMNFWPARSASRNRRNRSHCSRRTNSETSVGVSRSGPLEERTGRDTGAVGMSGLSHNRRIGGH